MTPFVLLALALGVLAAAWLTRPLWRRAGRDAENAHAPGRSMMLAAVLALFVLVVAGFGYVGIGTPQLLALGPGSRGVVAAAPSASAPTMEQIVAIVERALKEDPKNPRALALAGAVAYDRQDYAGAVRYWERLAEVEPADSPSAPQIRDSIAQARRMAGMPESTTAAAPAAPPASSPHGTQVSGTITLAPALRGRVAPDDIVFVFARAAEGPRMPLAVLRKQAKDLPLAFILDDSLAMSPAARLSGASRVVVGARVSKSGNPMPQPGDLQGLAGPLPVGASGVAIQINEEVTR